VGTSLLLLLIALVVAVHGIYVNDAAKGRDWKTALKIIGITLGSIVIGWWIHIPVPHSSGTLAARGPAIAFSRTLEIGNSGSFLTRVPNTRDPHILYLTNMNQSLLIEPINGRLVCSTKVLDKSGNLLVDIDSNHWRTPERPQISDWNYTEDALAVVGPTGRVVLQMKLLADRLQIQGEWWNEVGVGVRLVKNPHPEGGSLVQSLTLAHDPDEPRIEPMFQYPNTEHLSELRVDPPPDVSRVMIAATLFYGIPDFILPTMAVHSLAAEGFPAFLGRFSHRLEVMRRYSGSLRTRCLSASWKVSECSETVSLLA
jgi:hypothetical protein